MISGQETNRAVIISAASRRKIGAGAKGEMGEGWQGIAPSSGSNENNGVGTCEACHYVRGSPQEESAAFQQGEMRGT